MSDTERIVIEGSIVRHERISVVSETALSELEQHLVRYEATTFPVLPHGTVYLTYDRNTGRGMLLVEQKPARINIGVYHRGPNNHRVDYEHNRGPGNISRFNVQFPYQYFAYGFRVGINGNGQPFNFTIDQHNLYWRKTAFTQPNDELWVAHVPNVNSGGGICWGSTLAFTPNDNLAVRINAMVNNFVHTTFNEDLGHRTPFGTSLLDWERDSENPLNYLNWPLWDNERHFPVSDLAAEMGVAADIPIAEINPAHVDIPELPQNFTVGRARAWLNGLPEATRRRMILALTEQAEELAETAPTPQQIADALAAGANNATPA